MNIIYLSLICIQIIFLFLQRRKIKKLIHQLKFDDLTNVFRRKHFEKLFVQRMCAIKEHKLNKSLVYFMVDVDDFKALNDTYGHPAGDKILKTIASSLKIVSNAAGGATGRYGGEEFCISIEIDHLNSRININKFVSKLLEKVNKAGYSVSVGITIFTKKEEINMNNIIKKADLALYKAKHNGKNQYQFSKEDK